MLRELRNKYKKMSLVTKAAMWFVVCTMLQKCVSFITVPIFTRLMPTVEYGLYSTYLSWYNIITVICTLNMHTCIYMNQISNKDNKKTNKEIAIPMISLSETITLVFFIIYMIFCKQINNITGLSTPLICLMFIQVFFDPVINFWLVDQRFSYKYINLVIKTIVMVSLNSLLGIIFVVISQKNQAIARTISIVSVQMTFGIILYWYFFKGAKKKFLTDGWKHILKVQLPLLPHGLSLMILGSADKIMINSLKSSVDAAIYSVAYSAGYVVNILKNSIVDALRPWIYEKIKNEEFDEINIVVNPILLFIMLIFMLFCLFAPEIIKLMAPKEYLTAIYVIPPVAASAFFTFLYNTFSIVSFYFEKTKDIMIASIVAAFSNIVLNWLFIPKYGFIAAGYTTLICYMILAFFHFIIMRKTCKVHMNSIKIFDEKIMLFLSICVIVITIFISLLYKNSIIRYSLIGVIILFVLINRSKIINLLKKIKKKNTINN